MWSQGRGENLAERGEPHVDEFGLRKGRHLVSLGSCQPAGKYRISVRILGPPSRDRCVGKQERQVAQILPAQIGPPSPGETKEKFDDIAESDIGACCSPLTRR